METTSVPGPRASLGWLSIPRQTFETGLLWFAMAISCLVWIEPAPFDFMVLILIGTWLMSGLHIPKSFTVPVVLFGLLSASALFGAFLSDTMIGSGRHALISIFLYILAVGLGAYVARDPGRVLPVIMSGYTVAAIIAASAGIAGYFSLVGGASELFVVHERASGTFKDPNVFGPFLVVPIVYSFLRHLTGEERIGGLHSGVLAVLCLGILLSFSRGAWANLVFSSGIATYLLFISVKSNNLRLKVIGLTVCLGLIGAGLLVFALSFDTIADLMSVRAQLVQSYDTSERFAGAAIALDVILTHPFGIGARSFANFHEAEPHNVYIYSFLIGGWIGGFAFIFLVLATLYAGLRCALVNGPLRLVSIVLFSTFLALALEGLIIDIDHWRHFYILMGCIWGSYAVLRNGRNGRNGRNSVAGPAGMLERIPKIPRLVNRMTDRTRDAILQRGGAVVAPLVNCAAAVADRGAMERSPRRKQWRRRLGQRRARIQTVQPAIAPAGLPETRVQAVSPARPISVQELRAAYASIMTNPAFAPRSPDRERFGVRPSEALAERAAFGYRSRT